MNGFPPKTTAGKERHAKIVKMHVEEKKSVWQISQELHVGDGQIGQIIRFYCGKERNA